MAPTLQPIASGSRPAERWFAHSERTQPLQPLEGSSFVARNFETNPSTRPVEILARTASSGPTSATSVAAIAAILGGALAIAFCEFLFLL